MAAIRRDSQIPIVLYIYFNLIHRVGLEKFIRGAAKAGVDGLLVLDLPPEESDNYESLMRRAGLCHIYLVAPTTPEDRMELIVKRGSGFIYYISREGVTGMQTQGRRQPRRSRSPKSARIRAAGGRRLWHLRIRDRPRLVAPSRMPSSWAARWSIKLPEHGKSPELVKQCGRVCEVAGIGGERFVNQDWRWCGRII